MLPKNSGRNIPPAPDQIFSAGFRDGMNRRPKHPQFDQHPLYLQGYQRGTSETDRPPQDTSPVWVSSCCHCTLSAALQCIATWEHDRSFWGFGTIALSFRYRRWVVLVSQDLHDTVLSF